MKEIVMKLKCHTPWCKYEYDENPDLTLEELEQRFFNDTHNFYCNGICDIKFTNLGKITISFIEEKTLDEIRDVSAILLYFISICNGFNCEYAPNVTIDSKEYKEFFSFAPEDATQYPLLKNLKFYDVSLQEIKDNFVNILCDLLSANNRRYYLSLLSNYYSLLVYKDFIGNGEYRFRNIVTVFESLATIMFYETKYKQVEAQNKEYFAQARERLSNKSCTICANIDNEYTFSKTKTDAQIMPKSVSLDIKLQDIFNYTQKFGLFFKLPLSNECKRIAYTRNFISHLFTPNNNLMNREEMSTYTAAYKILFRMVFLSYCGIDNDLIKKNFLRNEPIRQTLNKLFDIN